MHTIKRVLKYENTAKVCVNETDSLNLYGANVYRRISLSYLRDILLKKPSIQVGESAIVHIRLYIRLIIEMLYRIRICKDVKL